MPLSPGEVVDRYVIESLLGAGGMGEVYRARDTRLQRLVALKILRESPDAASGSNPSTGGSGRLLREARAAAALEHANVVSVFDVGHVDLPGRAGGGITYLAMELIKGFSLRRYVGDDRVPVRERLRWMVDVARALGAAHRAGMVHRDVKPENVMIREDGAVKVLDFGIARRTYAAVDPTSSTEGQSLATLTAKGLIVGTPMYMAPEQLRADQLDGRADQFAWAVVAYELLSGKSPWSLEEGAIALVAQILSRQPPALESLVDLPVHVPRAIARAMQKDREARFASMDALIEALAGKTDPLGPTMSYAPPDLPSAPPLASPRDAAFVSAPTEAVLTPPPSRKPSAPPADAPPAPRRHGVALAALAIGLAVAAGVTARLHPWRASTPASELASAKPAGECTDNKACIAAHGAEPWICRQDEKKCVPLASEDCSVLAEPGDVELDSTVWFGLLMPVKGDEGRSLTTERQGVELARRDFAETLGRIGSARRIGVVSCDTTVDLARAARHLGEEVHAPAVIVGLRRPEEIIDVVPRFFTKNDVVTMVTLSASPLVTALPPGASGQRLVYRSTYSTDELLAPTATFVESVLEPRLAPARARPLRVAFLHDQSLGSRMFYDRLLSILHFNGKSVVDNTRSFRDVSYDDSDASSFDDARADLLAFKPDIVLARPSSKPVFDAVIEKLEAQWPKDAPKPTYLFSRDGLLALIASDPSKRRRFFGMASTSVAPENLKLVNHYNQVFHGQAINLRSAPGTSFDAFYALAYGVHALGAEEVSGTEIARSFSRLRGPGPTVQGPSAVFDAYRTLLAGQSVDLEGSGHLELDPATGESSFDIAITCAAPAHDDELAGILESGLVFSSKTHAFGGKLACP